MRQPLNMTRAEFREELRRMADELISPHKAIKRQLQLERARKNLAERFEKKEARRLQRPPPTPRKAFDGSGVYVIGLAGHPVKIGVARDVNKRVSDLQTGFPYRLQVFEHFEILDGRAYDVERECHRRLHEHRTNGEWFNVEPQRAIDCVRSVAGELLVLASDLTA